ncbi:putative amidophosphoribosyltransferase [Clostridium aceticum]|uniref:Putative amidophosphoribosyltransferase n=1 Tax=Clostridium aceticum TaxID=84022 RepID=A0A0G3W503_9CLOT|nr:ComF family protein [Clostridium aceticum]AKL93766.1 putative amidophosphoribosyltransferase [Clostridium aceticum]
MKIFRNFEDYFEALLDLVYPPDLYCIVCNKYLSQEKKHSICQGCFEETLLKKYAFQGSFAVGPHEGSLKKLVYRLKYQDATYLARAMGAMMAEVYKRETLEADILMAVPLHQKKEKQRGYNQAHLLVKYMSKKLGIAYMEHNLIRVKDTDVMYNQTRQARQKNIEDAFYTRNPQAINKKKILLVDDIFTTGATVEACKKALIEAEARSVEVLTFTRGMSEPIQLKPNIGASDGEATPLD